MWKKATIALGALVAGLSAGSVHLIRQLDAERDSTAAESAARQSAESLVKDMQARYDALESSYVALAEQNGSPGNGSASAVAKVVASGSVPPRKSLTQNFSTGFRDPETHFGPAGGERMRPMGPRGNAKMELVRYLKLGDADSAKLVKTLTDDEDKFRQALTAADGKLDPQVAESLRNEADQHVHEALGDAKYAEYEDYRKYMPEHEQINRLNMRLANENEGLSTEQQDRLFTAMKEEKNKIPAPTSSQYATRQEFVSAFDQWREAYSARSQTRAATILTPDQLTTFQTMRNFPLRGPPPSVR